MKQTERMSVSDYKTSTKVITLPTFDGTQEEFQQWWTKFMGYMNLSGFIQVLKEGGVVNLPETKDSKEDDQEKLKARKRNTKQCFNKQKLQEMVHKLQSTKYPSSLTHLIANQLKRQIHGNRQVQ